ncbi:allantoate amidohydrolase [Nocardioides acrostichi]|uniref:Allantoate amidohydrolase n=1 Tax=Nocardioides acrostichi TaxID=2784339 RepID=A0A930Y6Q2_9ACTN|nr:allantoate amidohydrolase [Nocardioides acrostichi]MBF4161227.1 allantoate amidohydrolase [Nocardioides acrostichi]
MSTTTAAATRALERCAELDRFSSLPHALERVYLSPEHAAANALAATWMQQAGLRTWVDAAGNQWGRVEGRLPGLPALVLGSHLDTVPDAGSYDGMLGVVMAIEVVERLIADGRAADLPFAIEVVGFSDEEGTRFGKALLGSQAVAGTWDDDWWTLRDKHGTTLLDAFTEFGLDPRRVGEAARRPDELTAYLEAHIEQGPYLEAADASLGFVTTIAGARRFSITVHGEARHAGGTPFERRRDALVGASEMVSAIERLAIDDGTIATVGRLEVSPGAVNVIPGRAVFSLDLRGETDEARDGTWLRIETTMRELARARGLRVDVFESHTAPAAPCAPWLQQAVIEGIRATGTASMGGSEPIGLWSRAGHDAMAMAAVSDIGMLFVRCFDGISHHPGEDVREIDVARGIDAFEQAVLKVARVSDAR